MIPMAVVAAATPTYDANAATAAPGTMDDEATTDAADAATVSGATTSTP